MPSCGPLRSIKAFTIPFRHRSDLRLLIRGKAPTDGRPSLDGLALGCFFTSAPDGVGLGAIPTKHSRTSPSHTAHKCRYVRVRRSQFVEVVNDLLLKPECRPLPRMPRDIRLPALL